MINDLERAGGAPLACDAEVCIVGAGTAGLFLAQLLREHGMHVVLLEAGGSTPRDSADIGALVETIGDPYAEAGIGRRFGLGGTSSVWGGQLIPMVESAFQARTETAASAWPIAYSELARFNPAVRRILGLHPQSGPVESEMEALARAAYPQLHGFDPRFKLRLSEWLPFRKRNFASLFASSLSNDAAITVWLNATVTGMTRSESDGAARIDEITAQSQNGHSLRVRAKTIVIAAGALETTRLLLAFDESTRGSITRAGAPLGRYFTDHLSSTRARIVCYDWHRYTLAVAPVFKRGIMHTPRLELSAAAQNELGLTGAFAHFISLAAPDSGFIFIRDLLRSMQGSYADFDLKRALSAGAIGGLCALAYWRVVHRRLWIPKRAGLYLRIDAEQAPRIDSRMFLAEERDAFGRRLLALDWRVQPSDRKLIERVTDLFIETWQSSPLNQVAALAKVNPGDDAPDFEPREVSHPAGSARMGTTAANSVVDDHLRLWGTYNCYVSSTAVFPSTGGANPGLTHLALTARLAEDIAMRGR